MLSRVFSLHGSIEVNVVKLDSSSGGKDDRALRKAIEVWSRGEEVEISVGNHMTVGK